MLLLTGIHGCCAGEDAVKSLTYAVYPYLPDVGYYQELVERRWAEIEPEIELVRAEWNCYEDGEPLGIDVIMYDAIRRNALIEAGWIQPVDRSQLKDAEEIYPYVLDGLTVDGELYGFPAFLCGNFLIYDRDCDLLAQAEHITDLKSESELLAIATMDPTDREAYVYEVLADLSGEANPTSTEGADEMMALIDTLAIEDHKHDGSSDLARVYDAGVGKGYLGYSESMCLLNDRISDTDIKSISFSSGENVLRLYVDAAAVTSGVTGLRYEKCVELMNVLAEANILEDLSVRDGRAQYLLLPRKSLYAGLSEQFPLYLRLEELASDEENHIILR